MVKYKTLKFVLILSTICSRLMKTKLLSELEQEVMNIVWEFETCSVRDVLEQISKQKELAYTTVATILQRLYEKGLVVRNDKDFAVHYAPKVSKESYSKNMAKSFIQKFVGTFGDIAIASFAESVDKLPKEKKKYFLSLLDQYDKNS